MAAAGAPGADAPPAQGAWHHHLQGLGDAVEVEVQQLRRRYAESFREWTAAELAGVWRGPADAVGRAFSLAFQPSDPAFKFKREKGFAVLIVLPRDYPQVPSELCLLDEDVSPAARRVVAEGALRYARSVVGEVAVRKVLRFLDRSLEPLLEMGAQLEARAASAAAPAAAAATAAAARPQPQQPQQQQQARPAAADEWTPQEQAALEAALEATKGLSGNERWTEIARRVGKTKRQCVERFQSLRELYRTGRAGVAKAGAAVAAEAKQVAPRRPPARDEEEDEENEDEEEEDEEEEKGASDDSGEDGGQGSEEGSGSEDQSEEEEEEAASGGDEAGQGGGEDLNPQHRGTQVLLEGLQLGGVSVVRTHELALQLVCARCECAFDAKLHPSRIYQLACPTCQHMAGLRLRSQLLHERNASLGYVDTQNCSVFDVLPSAFIVGCIGCMRELDAKDIARGRRYEWSCVGCHAALSLAFEGVSVVRVGGGAANLVAAGAEAGAGGGGVRRKRKEPKSLAGFQVGQPLPNKGACKHYRHSYRWFRFPCCGKAFPCDICHDAVSDHPAVLARRIICGACSREQSAVNEECACGQSFKSAAKAFWEGGKGNRNTTTLSRKDPRKGRGLGKTVSRSAMRKKLMQSGRLKKSKAK